MSGKKLSADDLKARVEAKYSLQRSFVCFREVGAASGTWGKAGAVDVVAICLSSSRSFAVHGFEVKVSRSDWLSELNNPSKGQIAQDEVDYWWIVAPSTEIVPKEELPAKWGLLTCSGHGLTTSKRAIRLHDEDKPWSRAFVVSLLWKFANWESPSSQAVTRARDEGYREGYRDGQTHAEEMGKSDIRVSDELLGRVNAFHKAAGYPLSDHAAGDIGALCRALLKPSELWNLKNALGLAARQHETLRRLIEDAQVCLADVEQRLSAKPPADEGGTEPQC